MYTLPPQFNQPYKYNNSPQFRSKFLRDKALYALSYLDAMMETDQPTPSVYIQTIPSQKPRCGYICDTSDSPEKDLKFIYNTVKADFTEAYRFLNYQRLKNYYARVGAYLYVVKSGETPVGFYAVHVDDQNNMYVDEVDILPRYRNTKEGAKIIMESWENITNLAKKKECKKLSLHVNSGKKNLVNLYKHLGFEIVENSDFKYNDGNDAYYMEKDLSSEPKRIARTPAEQIMNDVYSV